MRDSDILFCLQTAFDRSWLQRALCHLFAVDEIVIIIPEIAVQRSATHTVV